MFTRVAEQASAVGETPFDFIVVDESQDISMSQLRFLAALCERMLLLRTARRG